MHRRNRHTLLHGVLAASVALGGTALAVPAAAAAPTAVPAASCTVTKNPQGEGVVITGEGFTGKRDLNDGQTTEPLTIAADGTFRVERPKNADYVVLAHEENQNFIFVNCKDASGQKPGTGVNKKDYDKGYRDGLWAGRKAARTDCDEPAQPDKSKQRSESYWNGWTAGAQAAFDKWCYTGSDGGPVGSDAGPLG
ncbi:hypothetical protein [Streptomyces sp. NPDC047976]|uniref:hypothetical protein n=1 Tax=unclassified Streptomyces TaxID=2593676 RepID=UPI00343F9606